MAKGPKETSSAPEKDKGERKDDRRRRHVQKQLQLGFTRYNVRCHVDDVPAIKKYAETLLAKRRNVI